MVDSGEKTQTEVAELFDMSKATLSRLISEGARKTAPRPLRSSQARTLSTTMWVYGPEPGLLSGFSGSTVPGAKLVGYPIISVMTLSRRRFKPAPPHHESFLPLLSPKRSQEPCEALRG
jgi:hypothetical protein